MRMKQLKTNLTTVYYWKYITNTMEYKFGVVSEIINIPQNANSLNPILIVVAIFSLSHPY